MFFFKKKTNKVATADPGKDTYIERDFSFLSGERQTSQTLDQIRYDHKVRYQLAADYIASNEQDKHLHGLDVFCGNGYGTSIMASADSVTMLGIEGSSEAVAFANEHYGAENILYSAKLFPFKLPVSNFDFITCFESLEHVEHDHELLQQIGCSLKPGGLLFISFPNQTKLPFDPSFHSFHFRHYTHDDFMLMLNMNERLRLLNWYGQDVYNMAEPGMKELDISHMALKEKHEGQFLFYICEKLDKNSTI